MLTPLDENIAMAPDRRYIIGNAFPKEIVFKEDGMNVYTVDGDEYKNIEVSQIVSVRINSHPFGYATDGFSVTLQIYYSTGAGKKKLFWGGALLCKASDPQMGAFLKELKSRVPGAKWIDNIVHTRPDGSTSLDLVVFPMWSLMLLRIFHVIIIVPALLLGAYLSRGAALIFYLLIAML